MEFCPSTWSPKIRKTMAPSLYTEPKNPLVYLLLRLRYRLPGMGERRGRDSSPWRSRLDTVQVLATSGKDVKTTSTKTAETKNVKLMIQLETIR